jgi:hypothetical protein
MTKSNIGGNVQNVLIIDLVCYEHKFKMVCGLINDWMTEVTPLYIGVEYAHALDLKSYEIRPRMSHESIKKILSLDFSNMSHESIRKILLLDFFTWTGS